MYRPILALLVLTLGLAGPLAQAQEFTIGDIQVKQPWSRATPKGSKVGAGYLTITNRGAGPDRLIAISAPGAGKTEIHEMAMKDGVMTMRPLPSGILIEGGKTVSLRPGGLHIMFLNLRTPLQHGETFKAQLEFEKAGRVDVTFEIKPIGARGPSHAH